MKKKIIVIGSSNVDLIMKMDRLPEKGETITNADFYQVFGGKGANQAVAAVRAGGDVAFVNCVGDDAYAPKMLENFKSDGLDIRYVFHEKGIPSGHALVMIGDEGANYLSVAPGANYKLSRQLIDRALPVIEEAAMIMMQYEIPVDTIKHVFNIAEDRGIPVMWNFAPAREFDLSYVGKTSILVVNETEAAFLSGQKVDSDDEVESTAMRLKTIGAKHVIITLGKRGAFALSDDEKIVVPSFEVDAMDTTSAGDVFCGCLAVSLVEGKPLAQSLRFSCAASAICVTRIGAQPSAPYRGEIDEFLKEHV